MYCDIGRSKNMGFFQTLQIYHGSVSIKSANYLRRKPFYTTTASFSGLEENASVITAGDSVNEHHFPIVVGLLIDKSRHEADKAEEWRQVEKEQATMYVDLGSD